VGTFAGVTSDSGGNNSWGPWYATESSDSQFPSILKQQTPSHRQPKKRRTLLFVVIAAAIAVIAGIAAVVVTVVSSGGSTQTTGFLPSSASSESDAQQTGAAFLQAWQSGDLQKAANYTSDPAAAKAALATYKKYLNLKKLTTSVSSATDSSVAFAATAKVATSDAVGALSGNWSYNGTFDVYQEKNGNYWYVKWAPDDVAPNLTATTRLAAVQVQPQVVSVTDSSGTDITSYGDVGLNTIAGILEKQAPTTGTDGLYVEIQTNKGATVANSQAVVVAPSNVASLATTIDSSAEKAAQSGVSAHTNSSMVVIQPSTGKILAIANNNATSDKYDDNALTAGVAPGSTMKTITSTALFNKGLATADSDVACPPTYTVQGITYHDDNNESLPASTPLYDDYAQSCNNAFDKWWQQLSNGGSDNSELAVTAKEYYGLNQQWDIGIGESASYMNVPTSASGSELAQELFGEGELTASPLAMASVAATVYAGQFHEPYVVSGTKQTVTATALPSSTDTQLKQMMRAVVTEGTADDLGFSSTVYAKTGTADIVGQDQPNSWLIAFDTSKDVAVACLVLNAGYGAQFAGPEVKTFLNDYSG
jgi:hypothetical protein